MLKITRAVNGEVVIKLSGRMGAENIGELEALVHEEADGRRIVLDLKRSNFRGSRRGQFSQALRSGQHHAQELPSVHPRVDHEISRRKLALSRALVRERRKYSGRRSKEWRHKQAG